MVTLQMSAHSYPRGVSFELAWDKRLIQHEDIDDFEYQMKLAVRIMHRHAEAALTRFTGFDGIKPLPDPPVQP